MTQSTEGVPTKTQQLVVFYLGDEVYGIAIGQVREIIRVPDLTKVPRAPRFVQGVINLRGSVIPVIDLRERFELPAQDGLDQERIVVIDLGEQWVGMRVDRVAEVRVIEDDCIEPPSPYVAADNAQFVTGIVKQEDQLIILLDLAKVLSWDEEAQLTARHDNAVGAAQEAK